MTSPDTSPVIDQVPVASAVVADAERLGVAWQWRLATVVGLDRANYGSVTVVFDNPDDSTPVQVISAVGDLGVGDRVYVQEIPPGGNYIVGAPSIAEYEDVIEANVAATQTTVGTTELNLARLEFPSFTQIAGRLHVLHFQIISNRGTITDEFEVRLRQSTALTGTLLAAATSWGVPNNAGQYVQGWMQWIPATTLTASLFLSIVRTSGAGTITLHYSTFNQLTRTIVRINRLTSAYRRRTITT